MSKGFLTDRKQVESYVESELAHAPPSGWTVSRPNSARLWWVIKKASVPAGEWFDQEYSVHVSEDLAWFIVTYGNNDIGMGSLAQEFQTARLITKSSLQQYSLRSCVQFVMQYCKPNEWGYT